MYTLFSLLVAELMEPSLLLSHGICKLTKLNSAVGVVVTMYILPALCVAAVGIKLGFDSPRGVLLFGVGSGITLVGIGAMVLGLISTASFHGMPRGGGGGNVSSNSNNSYI